MDIKITNSPPINAHLLFIISYLISLSYHNEFSRNWRKFPFKVILAVLLVTHLMVGIMDDRLNFISKLSRPLFIYAQSYCCLFIGFTAVRHIAVKPKVFNLILIIFSVLGAYGILTFILNGNPYYDAVSQMFSDSGEKGMFSTIQERGYRVCSFLNNPIAYGFIMGIVGLLLFSQRKRYSWIISVAFIIIVMNVFMSNSRSAILSFLLMVVIFSSLKMRYSVNIKYFISILMFIIGAILAYILIPVVGKSIDGALDIFTTGGNNVRGSNVELKESQLTASLIYFNKSPIWGNGYYFFWENISVHGKDEALAGLEGYLYRLLIEEGIIQIIAVAIFFFSIFKYFIKSWTSTNNLLVSAALAMGVALLFFVLSVGTYGNVFVFSFFFLGIFIRLVEIYKQRVMREKAVKRNKIIKEFSSIN